MSEPESKRTVLAVIAEHTKKAQTAEYDRAVAINAIACARSLVEGLPTCKCDNEEFGQTVIEELNQLRETYHDPDGQFTSGKGILGSLLDDVCLALSIS